MSVKRCAYIYQTGDKKVISGERKVGEQCWSTCRNVENMQGLCGGHFKSWNSKNNPEVVAESSRKQSESLRKSRTKMLDKYKAISDSSNQALSDTTKEILQVLGKNEKYDLAHEYALLKRLNPNPHMESYCEKFAFAMWLNTPESARTPKELTEVGTILGVAENTIGLWRRSPEVVRIINNKAKESFCRAYGYITEKLLERVAIGSEKAMDVGLKHIKEIEVEMGANRPSAPSDPKLLAEAVKINEEKISNLVGVANAAKKNIVYESLVTGNVKSDAVTN